MRNNFSYRLLNHIIYAVVTCWIFFYAAVAQTRSDIFIKVGSADSLDATYFTPAQSPPAEGYPAVIFIHGFGNSKETKIQTCSLYAASGYLALAYTVRGHGNSSGLSTIMSVQERGDLKEVLRYLKNLPDVDTSSVGIVGSSQGGIHGLWAAADSLPVAAIITDLSVPDWASDMLRNGCIRRTLLLLLRTSTVRYYAGRDSLWEFARSDSYDSLKSRFPRGRDIDTAQMNSSMAPMMTFLKWQDHYFTASGGIEFFLHQNAPKKLYLGTQGHWSDESLSEQAYQSDQISRWLKYFLLHRPTGILDDQPVEYAYSSLPMDSLGYFKWTHEPASAWPPAITQPVRFYLGQDSVLLDSPPRDTGSKVLVNNYLKTSYTFDTAWIEGFKGKRFDAILPRESISFNSLPLQSDLLWTGAPRMKLFVSSDYEKFPIHAQIYELDSLGRKYFINRINFTVRQWQPGSEGVVEAEGIPHAHKFLQGSRIHVELTNMDKTNRIVLGEYPFVSPVFSQSAVKVFWDTLRPSYVEIPFRAVSGLVRSLSSEIPVSDKIFQNYPNPFNPTTTVRFEIKKAGFVAVKIFDVMGRAVQTLVGETKQPGTYEVVWNASGFATGVYFCFIRTAYFTDCKKMLYVK